MADHGRSSSSGGAAMPAPGLPAVRSVLVDGDALVHVSGTLESSQANFVVVRTVRQAVGAGATGIVLDLAEVDFAGVELVTLLSDVPDVGRGVTLVVLSAPKTMLLAVDALRLRHLLDLRDEPSR